MVFRIITVLALAGYAVWLTYRRFQKSPAFAQTKAGRPSIDAFAVWTVRRAKSLFAACLAGFAIFRAKDNIAGPESFVIDRFMLRKLPRSLPAELVPPVLFWVFVVAGFVLAVTALGSMLRFFSLDTQVGLIDVHRYAALAAALAAMGFFDAVFLSGR